MHGSAASADRLDIQVDAKYVLRTNDGPAASGTDARGAVSIETRFSEAPDHRTMVVLRLKTDMMHAVSVFVPVG